MRSIVIVATLTLVLLATWSAPALAQPTGVAEGPLTTNRIERAIAEACAQLKVLQREDGSWVDYPGFSGATTALACQALLLAGEPGNSPCMKRALEALQSYKIDRVYSRACRAMAYAQYMRYYPELKPKLSGDAVWLARAQLGDGMWGYGDDKEKDGDNSNTQFAVIGMRDAALAGVEIDDNVWRRLLAHYTKTQMKDGGWTYRKPEGASLDDVLVNQKKPADKKPADKKDGAAPAAAPAASLNSSITVTAPSVASLLIVLDELQKTSGCPCKGDRSSGGRIDEQSVERALAWLSMFFSTGASDENMDKWKTYFHYGILRAGQASGLKTFGGTDWYQHGASYMYGLARRKCLRPWVKEVDDPRLNTKIDPKEQQVVEKEDNNGDKRKFIVDPSGVVELSLGVIFLVKGSAPVYMNKLKYDGDWNRHRRDLALMSQEAAKRLERPFRWQVVDVNSEIKNWNDSPLLYLGGEELLKLTDPQKKKLKMFCDQGGTLFIEANCGNKAFAQQAREVVKELWPEWPLTKLSKEHPLYSCQVPVKAEGLIEGIDDGVRAFVLFTDKDFSCAWQMHDVARNQPMFDMGINLYAYATDKAPPPANLVDIVKRQQDLIAAMDAWEKAKSAEIKAAAAEKRKAVLPPSPLEAPEKIETSDVRKVRPGKRREFTMNLMEHGGDYRVGLHYQILGGLVAEFMKSGVSMQMSGDIKAEELEPGAPDVLIVRGVKALGLNKDQKENFAFYLKNGGFVIVEATLGSKAFDEDFRAVLKEADLKLEAISPEDPFMKGTPGKGVEGMVVGQAKFTRVIREENAANADKNPELVIKNAQLFFIKNGDKVVGYYSPFDLFYSATGCVAYNLRGYDKSTAMAMLINMFLVPTNPPETPKSSKPGAKKK